MTEPNEPFPQWDAPQPVPEPGTVADVSAGPESPEPPAPKGKRPPWVVAATTVGVIALVAGGFFGAKALSHKSSPSVSTAGAATANGNENNNGNGAGGTGRNFRRPGTAGTITSISGNTLTVKSATTNSAVKVTTSSSTRVTTTKTVPLTSIAKGDRIFVTGTKAGSVVTATRVADMGSAAGSPNFGGGGAPGGQGGGGFGRGAGGGQGGQGGQAEPVRVGRTPVASPAEPSRA